MLGMFDSPSVGKSVGDLFGRVANDLRSRASESHASELQGERGVREDTFTDELQGYTNQFGTPFEPELDTDAFETCP